MPSDGWLSLATFVLPGPSTNYLDPRPANLPAQFYRLSSE